MLLLRWHDLSAALERAGDQHHLDAVNARARFDAYRPGSTSLPLLVTAQQPIARPIKETASSNTGVSAQPASAPVSGHAAPAHKPHHRPPPPRRLASENPFLDQDL